ncbi:hypothetical protein [Ralstonia sp.]|uniref:glycine-rich domain-containing protein n=1 Tax=Ralstonia sp. TaxID=54061 RepID=UPI0031E469E8
MYQIDSATAAMTQPASTAAGTAGFFTDGNPATATPATILPAEWLNAVMMELVNVVVGAGLTLAKGQFNQVLSAIKRLGQATIILTDTGIANAYTATNATPLVAGTWVDGVIQQVRIAHANAGASTYAPDGLPPIPIYGLGLQPLQGGELFVGGTAVLMRTTIVGVNGGNPICVLMECAGGSSQVAPATQSGHAMQLGQATGRLLRTSVYTLIGGVQNVSVNGGAFTTTGATTFVPLPQSTTVTATSQGGGGAGAGAGGATSTNVSLGAPGGSGAFGSATWPVATVGASQTITVGAGGLPASNAAGGNGGSSSVGSLMTTPGGIGGAPFNNQVAPVVNGNGSVSTPATGANIYSVRGGGGQVTLATSSSVGVGGPGGQSQYGAGAPGPAINNAGSSAVNYGSGGSGCLVNASGGSVAGGAGFAGIVILQDWA